MSMIVRILTTLLFSTVGMATAIAGVPPGTTWFWQLDGTVNQTYTAAAIYDIDMENATPALIASLKAKGHVVICYISIGEKENYRSDASDFPAKVIGKAVGGYPGENYVDIRAPEVFDINNKRIIAAGQKGCDGIEPDLDDTYTENTGFPLKMSDQLSCNQKIAQAVHGQKVNGQNMIVALKNGSGKNGDKFAELMEPFVDFAIVEQCFQYNECSLWTSFTVKAKKAVLVAEYGAFNLNTCTKASALRYSLAFFGTALNGKKYMPCP